MKRIREALTKISDIRIAVFGDYSLDRYLYVDPNLDELSVETGLVASQVYEKRVYAGCGGTIANNLRSLGADVFCIGTCGDDGEGVELRRCLQNIGADVNGMIVSDCLMTPTYNKPMRKQGDGFVEGGRFDFRNFTELPIELQNRVLQALEEFIPEVDAVIFIDQFIQRNTGVITDYVRNRLSELSPRYPKKIFYADSRGFSGDFRNMIIKCNNYELMSIDGNTDNPEDEEVLIRQAKKLREKTGCDYFVTRGDKGMVVCRKNKISTVPSFQVSGPVDICGAGDAATAGIVAGLALNLLPEEAAILGCCVSSLTIQQIGVTGSTTVPQVLQRLEECEGGNPTWIM